MTLARPLRPAREASWRHAPTASSLSTSPAASIQHASGPPNTGDKLRGPGRRRRPVTERSLQDVPVHGALGQDLVSFIALFDGLTASDCSTTGPTSRLPTF